MWLLDSEICTGEWTIFEAGLNKTGHGQIGYFDRLQLNFHGEERTVALRKLLEGKDAAVRAKLHPGN